MSTLQEAKDALDHIINIGRAHWYKPVQIAETLYHSRTDNSVDVSDLESYRNRSKHWRNDITHRLVGSSSSSSTPYQDNIWNENAMPPRLLVLLDRENKATAGAVERYIYLKFEKNLSLIGSIIAYVEAATPNTFQLSDLLGKFESEPGLKRSVDKAYEIVVYALFSTLVDQLRATVTLTIDHTRIGLLAEFHDFAEMTLGITPANSSITQSAKLYRVGLTNAADRGLDMWANFGPAIQVKHIRLDARVAQNAADEIRADKMVLVCKQADAAVIASVLNQLGLRDKIRGIVTEHDLTTWYDKCLHGPYAEVLANDLLQRMVEEFALEFPAEKGFVSFFAERNYASVTAPQVWEL